MCGLDINRGNCHRLLTEKRDMSRLQPWKSGRCWNLQYFSQKYSLKFNFCEFLVLPKKGSLRFLQKRDILSPFTPKVGLLRSKVRRWRAYAWIDLLVPITDNECIRWYRNRINCIHKLSVKVPYHWCIYTVPYRTVPIPEKPGLAVYIFHKQEDYSQID
jgi:hypothetical protein